MNPKEKAELDNLRGKRDIQRALKDSRKKRRGFRVVASTKDKISLATHVLVLLGLAIFKYILKIGTFLNLEFLNNFLPAQLQLSEKLVEGAMTVVFVLTLTRFIKVLFINGIEDTSTKFNIKRIFNLIVGIILFFIIVSILFANWYTAVVSLGLISLILGFALQTPISSFIAWIHIIITGPFRVGDRIKIAEATGDVIDIGYLETTLWETVGDGLSTSFYTGRIIRFPNSNVMNSPIYNYSWPLFPYIYDEARFFVGFNSDINLVETILKEFAAKEIGSETLEQIHLYYELLKETAVDRSQIKEKPEVFYKIHENMWIEASVRYLVEPKKAGELKSKLTEQIVNEFLKHSDKIIIPLGSER
jgi:small-conductance mechanosensitive channel